MAQQWVNTGEESALYGKIPDLPIICGLLMWIVHNVHLLLMRLPSGKRLQKYTHHV